MKTQLLAVLFLALNFNQLQASNLPGTARTPLYTLQAGMESCDNADNSPADIKIVFSQKRIWLLADEMPMKCLNTQIKNAAGTIVFEKCFTSKCADWSLNIEALPKGEYTLYLGNNQVEKFKK
jgi:hypothetical protein